MEKYNAQKRQDRRSKSKNFHENRQRNGYCRKRRRRESRFQQQAERFNREGKIAEFYSREIADNLYATRRLSANEAIQRTGLKRNTFYKFVNEEMKKDST